MKNLKFVAIAAISTSLTACGLPGTFYIDSFSDQAITGNDFNAELAKAYQQRVQNTMDVDTNGILAGMYTQKGEAALSGQNVLPWDHTVYQEQPTFRSGVPSDRSQKYNLDGLRANLISALDNGGRTKNPYGCAQAQAHYDWLVDETFQDTPPAQVDEEDKIAADLNKFISDCAGMASTRKVAPSAPNEWIVYFGWDRYDLTSEAQMVIDSVVKTLNNVSAKALSVVGFTDTSGNKAYNKKLSTKRANSVANALSKRGVSNVHKASYGETNLASPTKDGIREPLNRRAIISIK